ncbi:hypothetical protein B7486_56140, partial [cyanobacterium TDX16]
RLRRRARSDAVAFGGAHAATQRGQTFAPHDHPLVAGGATVTVVATVAQTRRTHRSGSSRASTPRKKAPSKTANTRKKAPPPPPPPSAVRQAVSAHKVDVWGFVLVVLGLVGGLGTYADLTGPAGRAIGGVSAGLFGLAKWVVPVALVGLGLALLVQARHHDDEVDEVVDDEDDGPPVAGRVALGLILLAVAGLGLLHLGTGAPSLENGVDEVSESAGVVGFLIGAPLQAVLATAGAVLVLVALGLLGVIVLTRVTVRDAALRAGDGVRPAGSALGRVWSGLFTVGDADPTRSDPVDDEQVLDLTGEVWDDDPEPEPEPEPELEDPDPEPSFVGRQVDPENPLVPVLGSDDDEADEPVAAAKPARRGAWKLPPMKLLGRSEAQQVDRRAVEETGRTLERALADHGVETRLVGMVVGPTVTRFELELGPGVKVARVTSLHKDIAYAMASPDVRILAPIPGRQAIGVEVPNVRRQLVAVGDILASQEARQSKGA